MGISVCLFARICVYACVYAWVHVCVCAYVHGCKCVGGCEICLRMHACMPYYCSVILHQLTNDKVLLELLVCFGKTTIIKTYILYIL